MPMSAATFRIREDQVQALRAEALRRAAAAGSGKPDASALVREAIDAWLKKHHASEEKNHKSR